jgi:hypothetical protein
MTQPVATVSQIATDKRLTRKVAADRQVTLRCKNHPGKHWLTDNRAGAPIHFSGEDGKLNHYGMLPPFKSAMKDMVSGKLGKREDMPMEYTAANVAQLATQYVQWEREYAFECECPTENLQLDNKYDAVAEVPA